MEVVIDTSVMIGFFKGHQPETDYLGRLLVERRARLTAITAFELKIGLTSSSKRERELDKLFKTVPVLPFDLNAALWAAKIENEFRATGEVIGVPDTLIAGICLSRNFPIATLNLKHYHRIPGLSIDGP